MELQIFNRDVDTLPKSLANCIVYWEKGCTGSVFYKGEVFDGYGHLVSDDTDESLVELIKRLQGDVTPCACCGVTMASWDETYQVCCDCEE